MSISHLKQRNLQTLYPSLEQEQQQARGGGGKKREARPTQKSSSSTAEDKPQAYHRHLFAEPQASLNRTEEASPVLAFKHKRDTKERRPRRSEIGVLALPVPWTPHDNVFKST